MASPPIVAGRCILQIAYMAASAPLNLTAEEKLSALRRLDRAAEWAPSDDQQVINRRRRNSNAAAGAVNAGYVQIRATSEGISITHNGRAAVVRRTRSGRTELLREVAQLNDAPARPRPLGAWLARGAAAVATDCANVLRLLRPTQRAHFHSPQ